MSSKGPLDYSLFTYIYIMAVSLWGGVVNYFYKVRKGRVKKFSLSELTADLTASGFSGVLVFWLCEWSNSPALLTAVLVGIAGHLGGRTVFLVENYLEAKYGAYTGVGREMVKDPDPEEGSEEEVQVVRVGKLVGRAKVRGDRDGTGS